MARSRRGRGEGSIYRRGDGTWCATISAGYSSEGKRRRKTVYGATKADVQDGLRKAASEIAAGGPVECLKLTVGEFLDRWLKSARGSLAPTSYERYKHVVENELKPYIGGLRLAKLEPVHVEGLYVTLKDAGRSPRAIQLAGVTLGCAIQHAVRVRLLIHNPVRGIPKPRVPRAEMKVWDSSTVAAFLKAATDDRLHTMYVLALSAGLRQGELFGLEWADVDFDGGSVTVRRSIEEISGKLRAKEPKTGKGRRIDLPGFAVDALRTHRATMLAEGHIAGPVFCAGRGLAPQGERLPPVLRSVDRQGEGSADSLSRFAAHLGDAVAAGRGERQGDLRTAWPRQY